MLVFLTISILFFRNGNQKLAVVFSKTEKRTQWEESFNEAKQKLGK